MADTYSELRLGTQSEQDFLRRVLAASGFEFSGRQLIEGRSGLQHEIDGVGIRKGNVVLVVSGPKDLDRIDDPFNKLTPRDRAELWSRDALLRIYDVAAVLELEGLKVDLMYFHNVLNRNIPTYPALDTRDWIKANSLPRDILGSWHSSIDPIQTPKPHYLRDIARSIGACYMGLNDLSIPELAAILCEGPDASLDVTRELLKRLRVSQYFDPPTDELLLTIVALANRPDEGVIRASCDAARELAHDPCPNVIVPETDYTDPVATARALEANKMISYEGTLTLKEGGREIVHRVRKTPQESFVIRLLKAIDLPGCAKSLVETIKKHG